MVTLKEKLLKLAKEYDIPSHAVTGVLMAIMAWMANTTITNFWGPDDTRYLTILIPVLTLASWIYLVYSSIIRQVYAKATGGHSWAKDRHYGRSYQELIDYFADADPLQIHPKEELPKRNWKESSGLVFGKKEEYLLDFAPDSGNGICSFVWGAPGDGKTTSVIIPSAMRFGMIDKEQKGSCMVVDLKGDIHAATKDYRHIKRFSTIHPEQSAHYDPLHALRDATDEERADALDMMATTLIPLEGNGSDSFWVKGARQFFTGIFLYALTDKKDASFSSIVKAIALHDYGFWGQHIEDSDCTVAKMYISHFKGSNEKNTSGCYSHLVESLKPYRSAIFQSLFTPSDNMISTDDLEACTDIYLQVDPNEMGSTGGPLLAMILNDFLSQMIRRKEHQTPPIAFLIDEFGQLPAMPVIRQSAALLRAYNVSLLFSTQSLSQVELHYGREGTKLLLDCSKYHTFLSIMDPDTQQWASKMLGRRKILLMGNSLSTGGSFRKRTSSGRSVTEAREPVMPPEQFGILPRKDTALVVMQGKYIEAEKTYFFKD